MTGDSRSFAAAGARPSEPIPVGFDAHIADELAKGRVAPRQVSEKLIARYLDEPEMPDVDLFIRTSGEQRISNFLLWQSAYAELVFLPILWPDFDDAAFVSALEQYAARERRFGAVVEPAAAMSAS